MNLLLALAVAVVFGTGAYLMLTRDLLRVVVGTLLMSNAANLFIMASALSRGREPIYPLPEGQPIADPLVQALTLTAIVITFGIVALLLSIVYRVYTTHGSIDQQVLAMAEREEAAAGERKEGLV